MQENIFIQQWHRLEQLQFAGTNSFAFKSFTAAYMGKECNEAAARLAARDKETVHLKKIKTDTLNSASFLIL